jgi:hypothetical protein
MNATKAQAHHNAKKLNVTKSTYGNYLISCLHYGKRLYATTRNSKAVDDWNSEPDEVDQYRRNRVLLGYISLCNEIIMDNSLEIWEQKIKSNEKAIQVHNILQ